MAPSAPVTPSAPRASRTVTTSPTVGKVGRLKLDAGGDPTVATYTVSRFEGSELVEQSTQVFDSPSRDERPTRTPGRGAVRRPFRHVVLVPARGAERAQVSSTTRSSFSNSSTRTRVGVAALVEYVAAVRDLQASPRVLLHHQYRDARPVHLLHLLLVPRREPRRGFVQQQHRRVHPSVPAPSPASAAPRPRAPPPVVPARSASKGNSPATVSNRSRHARGSRKPHLQVLPHAQSREHVVRLGHVADALRGTSNGKSFATSRNRPWRRSDQNR